MAGLYALAKVSAFGKGPSNQLVAQRAALQEMGAMHAMLDKNWPNCEGATRFAAYRAAIAAYDKAKLGLASHDGSAWPRRPYGVDGPTLNAVRAELTALYIAYLDQSPGAAGVMADDALKGIFATTRQCE